MDLSESSFLGWFLYSFPESKVESLEASTVLGRRRSTTGKLLPSETLPDFIPTGSSEQDVRYRDAELAVARYRGKVPSPQVSDTSASASSSDHYVDVDGEVLWDLVDLYATEESFEHTAMKTERLDLKEACRRVDVAVVSSMVNKVDCSLWRFSTVAVGDASTSDALQSYAKVFKLQIEYDRFAALLSRAIS